MTPKQLLSIINANRIILESISMSFLFSCVASHLNELANNYLASLDLLFTCPSPHLLDTTDVVFGGGETLEFSTCELS